MAECGARWRRRGVATACGVVAMCCGTVWAVDRAAVAAKVKAAGPHPRLLMSRVGTEAMRSGLARDPKAAALYDLMLREADSLLERPAVSYRKQGKRLLSVSREALRRVLFLSFAHRMTDDSRYAARAIAEMEAVAAFADWNPSHFLDTAEMTTGLAIGYDWLFSLLTPEQEATIRGAILEKGIGPSFAGHDGWAKSDNNWNQVCHGGMVLGALALAERDPDLAVRVIVRALDGLPFAMGVYSPDGVYPEGPGYWQYGTTYNVILIDALESALGSDFDLSRAAGFRETGAFPLLVTGPTGLHFNFSDCGQRGGPFSAVYWFARRWDDPGITRTEERWIDQNLKAGDGTSNRFLPLLLLWRHGLSGLDSSPRQPLHWHGAGKNPVVVHRGSWTDPDAVFLAAKAGSPSANHGHMDIGTFVLDADGARWSADLGADSYGALEARGMNIWARSQQSVRWNVYRYHNSSHSTLTVNGEGQRVDVAGTIVRFTGEEPLPHTVMDLGPVYAGQLVGALRGFALLPDGRVLIQDEIAAGDAPAKVRWAMTTPAQVIDPTVGRAVLEQSGKRLVFEVLSPVGTAIETFSTDPPNEWDSRNPGTRQVGFHVDLEPGKSATLTVLLTPGSVADRKLPPPAICPLAEWPAPKASHE